MTDAEVPTWHCKGFIRGVIDPFEAADFRQAISAQFGIINDWVGDDLAYGNPTRYVCSADQPEPSTLFKLLHSELGLCTIWAARREGPKGSRHPTTLWVSDPASGIEGVFHLDENDTPLDMNDHAKSILMPWFQDGTGDIMGQCIVHVPQSNHQLLAMMRDPVFGWSAQRCAARRAIRAKAS